MAPRGRSSPQAMNLVAERRMRPMLMATLSTFIGSQVQRPLFTVMVGDTLFSWVMLL